MRKREFTYPFEIKTETCRTSKEIHEEFELLARGQLYSFPCGDMSLGRASLSGLLL